MEYSKVFQDIDGEPRYWIKFVPYEKEPVFFIGTDTDKIYCFFINGQMARASKQMALDYGYDPEALK